MLRALHERHGYSLRCLARVLGLNRRTVAKYAVPKECTTRPAKVGSNSVAGPEGEP
jgi:predicted transcriptional regulator